jgi:hypothetical protein
MKNFEVASRDSIKCPECGEVIPITETLHHQLTEEARLEMRRELASEQKTLAARRDELETREAKLSHAQQTLDAKVTKRLAEERAKLFKEAIIKAREDSRLEVESLQRDADEKNLKLQEAQKRELDLRKQKRDLESAKESLELEVARKVDTERERIRNEALAQAAEQHRLKDAEKDKKLSDALQQGSQQTQGEVLELELEDVLRECCRSDEILPVPKGVHGADVLQVVRSKSGIKCGQIIWEAKHTKNWSDGWISKLKDDQQQAKADVAVLVTDVLPEDIECFGLREGVWITSSKYVPGLVSALRAGIEHVAQAKRAVASKNEMVEALFTYLTGPEFGHRVEAIMRSFILMKGELEEERRVTLRRWARREKQLDLVVGNTSGMYGDLEGLMGASLKPIASLEPGDSSLEHGEDGLTIAAESET